MRIPENEPRAYVSASAKRRENDALGEATKRRGDEGFWQICSRAEERCLKWNIFDFMPPWHAIPDRVEAADSSESSGRDIINAFATLSEQS